MDIDFIAEFLVAFGNRQIKMQEEECLWLLETDGHESCRTESTMIHKGIILQPVHLERRVWFARIKAFRRTLPAKTFHLEQMKRDTMLRK